MNKQQAEKQARKHFDKFNEIIEQAYGVRKHGYTWENKKILDKSNPNYKESKTKDIDTTVIQASLFDAIQAIGDAAMTLKDHRGKLRSTYFKLAIIYYETIHAWEHAYAVATIALNMPEYRKYFFKKHKQYHKVKNRGHDVHFDIDELLNKFSNILREIE